MLTLQALGQDFLVVARRDEVVIGRALAREDRAADVDEREDERRVKPLVLGLHVVGDALELYVCVESGDHENTV